MALGPIKKSITLKDQAYNSIKHAIYTSELKPGTPLTEEQLSSLLSISRTPIRTALQQLVFEKLAVADSTGHIYVSTITPKDVSDTNMLRSVLEPLVIEQCKFPISDETIKKLRGNYENQTELSSDVPEDNLKYAQLDKDFHCLIASLSDNEMLIETIEKLNTVMVRINVLSGTLKYHRQNALKEHASIINYLENGQMEFAKLALSEHIKHVENRMFSSDSNL